ncbi:MAG: serine/threonine-protein phosphatase [Lachnospiraceae bacterium]|nr:serine/threonine-protein phosphatase [Lachnospiraceae bacterium]
MAAFYAVLHECGRRSMNQDSIAMQRIETGIGEVTLALLCDGMGGMDRGEVASGYVAERLSIWFYDVLPGVLQTGIYAAKLRKSLQRTLFRIHEDLRQYGERKGIRCGTTMTMLLVIGRRWYCYHLGDSVAFLLGKKCRRITTGHALGSGVTRCIGIGRYHQPEEKRGRVSGKADFLLTSDGMQHHLKETDLYHALQRERIGDREQAGKALRALAKTAARRGEQDNLSAVFFRCG